MKLSTAIEGYRLSKIADGYSLATLNSYQSSLQLLTRFLQDPEIETITYEDLRRFFYYLRTDYQPGRPAIGPLTEAAIHGKWKSIRSLWRWAADELSIQNVSLKLPMPRFTNQPVAPFTEGELKKLVAACDQTAAAETTRRKSYTQKRPTALRDKALVLVLIDTGIRIGECSRLLVGDLDLETGQLVISPHGQGRKTHGRVVYLGKTARRMIWRYLAKRGRLQEGDPLFEIEDHPMSVDAMKNMVQSLGDRTGIDAHPHKFRHTFAIQYLRNGGDVFTLQRLLGHSSLDMVRRYLALASSDDAAAHRLASPADRWRL